MAALDSPMSTRLPNEMIEYIAKNLPSPKDLLALRMVCKAWSKEGERQLYARRSLTLFQRVGWGLTLDLNTLITVVLDLPSLVSLDISMTIMWDTMTAAKVSPTLASHISNKLRHLVVHGISPTDNSGAYHPFQILQLSSTWGFVEFGQISRPALEDGATGITELPVVEVETLRLIGSDNPEAPIWDSPGGDTGARYLPPITGLKTFKVATFNVNDVDGVRRTTIANAGTLKVLSLSVPFYVQTQNLDVDFLRRATSLRHFALRIPLFGEDSCIAADHFDQQKWDTFLTTVAFKLPPNLEVLILYFDFRHKHDETASSAHARLESHLKFTWKDLGIAVSLCHNLRALKLAICCDEGCASPHTWPRHIADNMEAIFFSFPRFQ
ncbi:hypothetical protein EIP86_009870, partial [Pleurotus ostreatoroseus]